MKPIASQVNGDRDSNGQLTLEDIPSALGRDEIQGKLRDSDALPLSRRAPYRRALCFLANPLLAAIEHVGHPRTSESRWNRDPLEIKRGSQTL